MNHEPRIIMIAAMAKNRAIGHQGSIPWDIPDDLRRFRALTKGHPCIMGRKTFESIVKKLGRPLPGRTSIIISRSGYRHDHTFVFQTIEDAIHQAQQLDQTVYICGGADIYSLALPYATHLAITEVDLSPPGDAFMPEWRDGDFIEIKREECPGPPPYRFIDYVRAPGSKASLSPSA